jgi:L-iditol 2-dehydrogenase
LDPGGLAERTRVPRVNLRDGALSIPDALSDEEAVFVEPLGCVLRGQRHARLGAGDSVLVLGCGAAGLLHVMAAKLRGARVVAVDTQKSRADWARRVGADRALVAGEEIGPALREVAAGAADGADVVVAATGAPAAVRTALDVVAPGGTILWFAPAGPDFVLEANFNRLWRDEIRMTASYAASPADLRQSLALLSSGRVSVRPLVTHRFPLAGVGEAFRLVAEAREGLKIVVRPNA